MHSTEKQSPIPSGSLTPPSKQQASLAETPCTKRISTNHKALTDKVETFVRTYSNEKHPVNTGIRLNSNSTASSEFEAMVKELVEKNIKLHFDKTLKNSFNKLRLAITTNSQDPDARDFTAANLRKFILSVQKFARKAEETNNSAFTESIQNESAISQNIASLFSTIGLYNINLEKSHTPLITTHQETDNSETDSKNVLSKLFTTQGKVALFVGSKEQQDSLIANIIKDFNDITKETITNKFKELSLNILNTLLPPDSEDSEVNADKTFTLDDIENFILSVREAAVLATKKDTPNKETTVSEKLKESFNILNVHEYNDISLDSTLSLNSTLKAPIFNDSSTPKKGF